MTIRTATAPNTIQQGKVGRFVSARSKRKKHPAATRIKAPKTQKEIFLPVKMMAAVAPAESSRNRRADAETAARSRPFATRSMGTKGNEVGNGLRRRRKRLRRARRSRLRACRAYPSAVRSGRVLSRERRKPHPFASQERGS